jgi:hypothetical protein
MAEHLKVACYKYECIKDQRPVRLAYQPPVLFSQNKPAANNQPTVLLSEQTSTSH